MDRPASQGCLDQTLHAFLEVLPSTKGSAPSSAVHCRGWRNGSLRLLDCRRAKRNVQLAERHVELLQAQRGKRCRRKTYQRIGTRSWPCRCKRLVFRRRDPEAVSALAGAAKDDDPVVAEAAIMALGAIGTESAAQTLAGLQVTPALSRAQARARITAAGQLKDAGANAQAASIYRDLMQSGQPQSVRIAALKGLIGALPQAEAVKLVTEMVQGEDAAMREATVAAYVTSTDAALQSAVASALAVHEFLRSTDPARSPRRPS